MPAGADVKSHPGCDWQLRAEAAEHRTRARDATAQADELARRLLTATIATATSGVLTDASDLPADGAYVDEDGFPDPERIRAAAEALVASKPHLADRRPAEPVDQGARGEVASVDLAGMLRTRPAEPSHVATAVIARRVAAVAKGSVALDRVRRRSKTLP